MTERFVKHIIGFCLLLVRVLNNRFSVPKIELCLSVSGGVFGEFTLFGQARF